MHARSATPTLLLAPLLIGGGLLAAGVLVPFDRLGPEPATPPEALLSNPERAAVDITLDRPVRFTELAEPLAELRVPETEVVVAPVTPEEGPSNAEVDRTLDWLYAGYMALGQTPVAFLTVDGRSRSAVVGDTVSDARGRALEVVSITPVRVMLSGDGADYELVLLDGGEALAARPSVMPSTAPTLSPVPDDILNSLTPEQRERLRERREQAEEQARRRAREDRER